MVLLTLTAASYSLSTNVLLFFVKFQSNQFTHLCLRHH